MSDPHTKPLMEEEPAETRPRVSPVHMAILAAVASATLLHALLSSG